MISLCSFGNTCAQDVQGVTSFSILETGSRPLPWGSDGEHVCFTQAVLTLTNARFGRFNSYFVLFQPRLDNAHWLWYSLSLGMGETSYRKSWWRHRPGGLPADAPQKVPTSALCQAFPPPASAAARPGRGARDRPRCDGRWFLADHEPSGWTFAVIMGYWWLEYAQKINPNIILGSPERGEIPKIWVPIIPIIPWFSWCILII